jgi:hypothetical protein
MFDRITVFSGTNLYLKTVFQVVIVFLPPIMIMKPLTAFSSDFRYTGAVPAYLGAIGIAVEISNSSRSSGVVFCDNAFEYFNRIEVF